MIRNVVPHNVRTVSLQELRGVLADPHFHGVYVQAVPSLSTIGGAFVKTTKTETRQLLRQFEGTVGEFAIQTLDHDVFLLGRVPPARQARVDVTCAGEVR